MDAVTVDGQDLGLQGRTAILDTGTTLILLASGMTIVIPDYECEKAHMRYDRCSCRISSGNRSCERRCDWTTQGNSGSIRSSAKS